MSQRIASQEEQLSSERPTLTAKCTATHPLFRIRCELEEGHRPWWHHPSTIHVGRLPNGRSLMWGAREGAPQVAREVGPECHGAATLLAHHGRPVPVEVVARWSAEEALAALGWAFRASMGSAWDAVGLSAVVVEEPEALRPYAPAQKGGAQ